MAGVSPSFAVRCGRRRRGTITIGDQSVARRVPVLVGIHGSTVRPSGALARAHGDAVSAATLSRSVRASSGSSSRRRRPSAVARHSRWHRRTDGRRRPAMPGRRHVTSVAVVERPPRRVDGVTATLDRASAAASAAVRPDPRRPRRRRSSPIAPAPRRRRARPPRTACPRPPTSYARPRPPGPAASTARQRRRPATDEAVGSLHVAGEDGCDRRHRLTVVEVSSRDARGPVPCEAISRTSIRMVIPPDDTATISSSMPTMNTTTTLALAAGDLDPDHP